MRSANKALLMIFPLSLAALILISFDNCSKKESSPAELFQSFSLVETESEDYAISSVTKIDFSSDKIFIFDKRQKRIFTLSDTFSFLYTIGSPGQGPGELDDPVDFAVGEYKIIVLERFPRRLDIFDLTGDFIGRVNLKIPEEISYSYPSGILPGPENSYLITYSLSSHLLDVYDDRGNYQTTWLQREDPVVIGKKTSGMNQPSDIRLEANQFYILACLRVNFQKFILTGQQVEDFVFLIKLFKSWPGSYDQASSKMPRPVISS